MHQSLARHMSRFENGAVCADSHLYVGYLGRQVLAIQLGAPSFTLPPSATFPCCSAHQALTNSWMALVMVAFITIICVSSSRTQIPEPGQSW